MNEKSEIFMGKGKEKKNRDFFSYYRSSIMVLVAEWHRRFFSNDTFYKHFWLENLYFSCKRIVVCFFEQWQSQKLV